MSTLKLRSIVILDPSDPSMPSLLKTCTVEALGKWNEEGGSRMAFLNPSGPSDAALKSLLRAIRRYERTLLSDEGSK